MKRLVRRAFEEKLYHGTKLSMMENIVNDGALFPQEEKGAGSSGNGDYEGYTFATNSIAKARQYANMFNPEEDIMVVLELYLPKDSLLPDTNDCPVCKTVEDSLKKIQQVSVVGPIYSNYIKQVYFYDAVDGKLILSTNFDNCLEELKVALAE